MKATINNIQIDLSKPIDISIPLTNNDQNPIAWYQSTPEIEPVTMGDWIGKVECPPHWRWGEVGWDRLRFERGVPRGCDCG